jgi:outer membrane protein assembly factor BamB
MLSAEDGKQISEIKIGDNVNATPAVLDGRIYIGAFNGKLYCLDLEKPIIKEAPSPQPSPRARRR